VTAPVETGTILRDNGRLYLVTGTCRDVAVRGKGTVYARVLQETTIHELAQAVMPL
jgi:hypothetical protein